MACWTDVNWAQHAIDALAQQQPATVTPHGNSMVGRVKSGQRVELRPSTFPKVGEVVLVKVKGKVYLHLVKAIRIKNARTEYLIGNTHGGVNGWVGGNAIYGIAINV
jgi:hypothetical protein